MLCSLVYFFLVLYHNVFKSYFYYTESSFFVEMGLMPLKTQNSGVPSARISHQPPSRCGRGESVRPTQLGAGADGCQRPGCSPVRTRPEGVCCRGPWGAPRAPHTPLLHTECFLVLKEMCAEVENLEDV